MTRIVRGFVLPVLILFASSINLCAQVKSAAGTAVNVTTYHNDNSRTGENTLETTLTPTNVNSGQFGKLFTIAVDSWVYAQPLFLSNIKINGRTHNVVYVATEHDSLYAIDAVSGAIYWQISLLPAGGRTVSIPGDINCGNIVPEYGITGTPVIDTSTGTIYLVAVSIVSGNTVHYLHALDVGTGAEKFGGPVLIQASVPGTGDGSNGTTVSFSAYFQNQRAALLLENGHVVIAWASHCDFSPWHGWVMSYNAKTLAQEGVFNTSPNGDGNGVWMGGGGIAADAAGNLYFPSGNGDWNGVSDWGDSIMKLGPPSGGGFPILDYFTPFNQATLAGEDEDVASAGLVLLPALSNGQQLMVQMAKEGKIYLLNTANLGQYCLNETPACVGGDPQIVQEIPSATPGIWGTPAYWNGNLYWGGIEDGIKAFTFNANNSGLISALPTSMSTMQLGYPGSVPTVSANGASNGIVWTIDDTADGSTCSNGVNCQVLYAYNANDLSQMLYNTNQAANNRDVPGSAVEFTTPTVAMGRVYVGSQYQFSAYGILSKANSLGRPTISPTPGTYSSAQTVTLSDSVKKATIYYTTNGTVPTTNSLVYSKPFSVTATTTVQAIAVESGFNNSGVASGTYIISAASVANLAPYYNVAGIATLGTTPIDGGLDGSSYAYDASLLGTSATYQGLILTFGPVNALDAVTGGTVPVTPAFYTRLYLLGCGVFGSQYYQPIVVTYTDGTTSTFYQNMSDWGNPQGYIGETVVRQMTDRDSPGGVANAGPWNLYGYSFPLVTGKMAQSVTLPNNRDAIFFGLGWDNN